MENFSNVRAALQNRDYYPLSRYLENEPRWYDRSKLLHYIFQYVERDPTLKIVVIKTEEDAKVVRQPPYYRENLPFFRSEEGRAFYGVERGVIRLGLRYGGSSSYRVPLLTLEHWHKPYIRAAHKYVAEMFADSALLGFTHYEHLTHQISLHNVREDRFTPEYLERTRLNTTYYHTDHFRLETFRSGRGLERRTHRYISAHNVGYNLGNLCADLQWLRDFQEGKYTKSPKGLPKWINRRLLSLTSGDCKVAVTDCFIQELGRTFAKQW